LGQDPKDLEPILRPFEIALLKETGFAAALDRCVDSYDPFEDDEHYVYQPERGIRKLQAEDPGHWPVMTGKHLRCMNAKDYSDTDTLSQSKSLTRFILGLHLQDQAMMTRQILIDLKKI
jgi:DNA repair protein RecO (recombination protein O)